MSTTGSHGSETARQVTSDSGERFRRGGFPGQGRLVADQVAGDLDKRIDDLNICRM